MAKTSVAKTHTKNSRGKKSRVTYDANGMVNSDQAFAYLVSEMSIDSMVDRIGAAMESNGARRLQRPYAT